MPDPTLQEVCAALVDQIGDAVTTYLPDLQTIPDGLFAWNPTPPTLDVLPADPFQEQERFGQVNDIIYLLLRVRTNTPDTEGAQELMLSLMDPRANTSVQGAIAADRTLGGTVSDTIVTEGPSNYGIFPDPSGQGAFLGCTWTVRVTL